MVSEMIFVADGYNTEKKRNILNTSCSNYNCGGFALGVLNWYFPYPRKMRSNFHELTRASVNLTLRYMVWWMLRENSTLRKIDTIEEVQKDEYAIAFRIGEEDFHFMRMARNGKWFHKRGGCRIEEISKERVFADTWFNCDITYTSKLVLFAKKRG